MTRRSFDDSSQLREHAEAYLASESAHEPEPTAEQAQRLVHELKVHQVELELQNEELRRITAELERSQQQYADLFHQAPIGYLALNAIGQVLEANQTFCRMIGRDRAQVLNCAFTDFVVPIDRQAFLARYRAYYHAPQSKHVELRLLRGNGEPIDVVLEGVRVSLPIGQPSQDSLPLLLTISDNAERKRAEVALRQSEERFRRTFDLSPVGAVMVGLDRRFIRCNEAFCRFTGYQEEELIGKSFLEITHPEDVHIGVQEIQALMAGEIELAKVEKRYLHKDGRVVWGETTIRMLPNPCGQEQYFIPIVLDITARKEAVNALQASEERFRGLVTNAPIAITVIQRGKYVYANPTSLRMLGYDEAELQGKDALCAIHPDCLELAHARLMRVQQGATNPPAEIVVLRKDGTALATESSTVPIEYHGDKAVLVIASDVTERKRAEDARQRLEQQIQQAQKLESLGVLAGGIAHDFNNLLTAILGYADLALYQLPSESSTRPLLHEIETASLRAADLCRQMLAYSGKGQFVTEDIDVNSVIREMVYLLKTSISKKANLTLHLDPDSPAMRGDATQLRQIVMNLVVNASEALGEEEGAITITTGTMRCDAAHQVEIDLDTQLAPGFYVWLQVIDTGCGMDVETRERLFDPFFSTKFTGRGLGLSAVLGIVRAHRGALKVTSAPGQGASFTVYFPAITKHDETPGDAAVSPASVDAWTGAGTILLVDDEEAIRTLGKEVLEAMGFSVLTAEDGQEAVDLYREHGDDIALVILDLTMPRLNGEEALHHLRAIDPGVRVILSSGYSEQDIAERFAGKDLAGFVTKPYTLATLQTSLRHVLENTTYVELRM
jgi:PAS domain S-box-containing protein